LLAQQLAKKRAMLEKSYMPRAEYKGGRTLVCQIVMEVAVMTAKIWPARATWRASTGSLGGRPVGEGLDETPKLPSSCSPYSTDLMAGVIGVNGVVGERGVGVGPSDDSWTEEGKRRACLSYACSLAWCSGGARPS